MPAPRWDNMWSMTPEETAAYERYAKFAHWDDVKDRCARYGLTQVQPYCMHTCNIPHALVVCYLDDHPNLQELFIKRTISYYELVNLAEAEYLGLPPFNERRMDVTT